MRSIRCAATVLAAASLGLAGCSGEPSSADIQQALERETGKVSEMAESTLGGAFAQMMQMEIHGVKKLACSKAENNNGYICDVEIDMTAPIVGRQKQTSNVRLVKTDEGWRALDR